MPQPSASGLERLGQPVPLGRGHMKVSAGLGRAGVKEIGFVPGTLLPHTRYIRLRVWLCGRKQVVFHMPVANKSCVSVGAIPLGQGGFGPAGCLGTTPLRVDGGVCSVTTVKQELLAPHRQLCFSA